MSGFVIEQVEDLDAVWPEIEALLVGIIEYHRPWDARELRPDWSPRMREYMASGCTTFLARDAAGEAVGFIEGKVTHDYGIFVETVAHVDNAFVVESHRRQGVGAQLLQRFEDWSRDQGATDLALEFAHGNDLGLSFWRKSGFEPRQLVMGKRFEASG